MRDYDFVLASGAVHLKERLEQLKFRVFTSELNNDGKRFFPNSDIYTCLPDLPSLSNRRVIVVQSCTGSTPSQEEYFTTSDRVQELIFILDLLKNPSEIKKIEHKKYQIEKITGPKTIEVVLTFQPFALQDKSFKTGESVSSRCAIRQIASLCDKMWVLAPVVTKTLKWVQELSSLCAYEEIEITSEIIEFAAKKFEFEDYIVVVPDEGAQRRFGFPGFKKTRSDSFKIEMSGDLGIKIEGKNTIIIDDLTKSGTSLLKAVDILNTLGAANIGLVVLHVTPIRENGEILLKELVTQSHNRIVVSNTVFSVTFCQNHPELVFDIVDILISALSTRK